MNVAVLGAGAWGTALARVLSLNGNPVVLWGHDPERLAGINRTRQNARYLPDVTLPEAIRCEPDIERAVEGAECIVLAVPSKAFRSVSGQIGSFAGVVASVTKGIEYDSGLTMCGVLRTTMPLARAVALSGPTMAMEVGHDVPTAIVAASEDQEAALTTQQAFHRASFRVYTAADVLGVELGGALKNVVAVAAGIGDGLGFGDNSKAALITRGIVEIRRLGIARGAQPETFSGLSGLGDLALTCYSRLSRNRALGERIGKGEKPEAIVANSVAVAEGYPTTRSAFALARKLDVATPIIDEVYALLYEGKNVVKALQDLMSRESKAEQ